MILSKSIILHLLSMFNKPSLEFRVNMSEDLAEEMQEIEDSTGMSRAEIFRRAIALYKRAKQTEKGKGNVILRSSDGTLREVVNF
jgi:metal-responsive CopG/Arc/MetJ family transcriptional regulator